MANFLDEGYLSSIESGLDPTLMGSSSGSTSSTSTTSGGTSGTTSNAAISKMADQFVSQWKAAGYPDSLVGVSLTDRAKSLASQLQSRGITDLSQLTYGSESRYLGGDLRSQAGALVDWSKYQGAPTQTYNFLNYGGQNVGYLGSSVPTGVTQNLATFMDPSGKGHVNFLPVRGPNGAVSFLPQWEASSDAAIVPILASAIMLAVPGIGQMIGSTITGALGIGASAAVNGLIGNTVVNTVLNGGDLEKAVKSSVGQWAGTEVGSVVGNAANQMFGSADAAKFIGNLASAGTKAAINGEDISKALTGAAAQGAVDFATSKIPGFSSLTPAVKNVITTSISTALQGGNVDITKMLENATKEGFLSYGLSQIPDFNKADPKIQSFITNGLRTAINGGDMSQSMLNWAINQAASEFKQTVQSSNVVDALNKKGLVSANSYVDLSPEQKLFVDNIAATQQKNGWSNDEATSKLLDDIHKVQDVLAQGPADQGAKVAFAFPALAALPGLITAATGLTGTQIVGALGSAGINLLIMMGMNKDAPDMTMKLTKEQKALADSIANKVVPIYFDPDFSSKYQQYASNPTQTNFDELKKQIDNLAAAKYPTEEELAGLKKQADDATLSASSPADVLKRVTQDALDRLSKIDPKLVNDEQVNRVITDALNNLPKISSITLPAASQVKTAVNDSLKSTSSTAATGTQATTGTTAATSGTTATTGTTGSAGATGAVGSTGTAGTAGTAGTSGTAGTTGTAGATGSTATTGTTGTAASSLTSEQVQRIVNDAFAANPSLTKSQVEEIVNNALKTLPSGATSDEVKALVESGTKNLATKADIDAAIANIKLPAGVTKEDVSKAISDYMTANPGLSIKDVASKITEATAGLATSAEVKSSISDALKGVATKADIDAAIAGIKLPEGVTKEDVSKAISDYMKANPGLSLTDVASKITDATKGLATTADVKTSIADALKGVATKSDIDAAIAGIKFPAGITKDDVSTAISDYMKANPGLSIKDVASKITEATSGLATSADVKTSIADALKGVATKADIDAAIAGIKFPAGLTKEDVSNAISTYMKDNPGLSLKDVASKIADATSGLATSADVKTSISDALKGYATQDDITTATKSLKDALTEAQKGNTSKFDDINASLKALKDAGLTEDQVQKIVDASATSVSSTLKDAIAEAVKGNATALNTAKTDLETKISDLNTSITGKLGDQAADFNQKVADLQAQGKSYNEAVNAALDGLGLKISDLGTDVAKKLTDLGADVGAKISDLNTSLSKAIDDAVAAGKTGDAALQDAIDAVSGKLGTTKDDLLAALGKTADDLKADYADKIAGVSKEISTVKSDLSKAIDNAVASGLKGDAALQAAIDQVSADSGKNKDEVLAALGKTEENLKSDFADKLSGVETKITDLGKSLSDAIADAKKAGLDGDAALQAAIDKVAGDQQTSSADILAKLGKTKDDLKAEFSDQLGGIKTDIAGLRTDILDAIADAKKAGLEGDAALQAAIDAVSTKLGTTKDAILGQLGTTESNLKSEFSTQLGAVKTDIDSRIADLQKQGLDQYTATRQALDELGGSVSTGFSAIDAKIADLMLQGQTYQQATTNALKDLGGTVTSIQTAQQQTADKAAFDAATQKAMNLVGQPQIAPITAAAPQKVSPLKQITTGGAMATFAGPLQDYLKTVQSGYLPQETAQQTQQTQQPMQNYFNYGQVSDINELLGSSSDESETQYAAAGGLMSTPLMAAGGGTRYGQYAGGGLNVVHHSGKARVDFRRGDAVTGPGDGQSDDIPAMLADGEFVFPADVVAALGNGSTKAGSDKLYEMMHSIRAHHRSAKPEDLPPPAKKSPLDYLKKGRR